MKKIFKIPVENIPANQIEDYLKNIGNNLKYGSLEHIPCEIIDDSNNTLNDDNIFIPINSNNKSTESKTNNIE